MRMEKGENERSTLGRKRESLDRERKEHLLKEIIRGTHSCSTSPLSPSAGIWQNERESRVGLVHAIAAAGCRREEKAPRLF
jgi:hypothetical protein